jgi:protein-disulfide isomerase
MRIRLMNLKKLLAATMLSAVAFSMTAMSANAFDDAQKKEIGAIVKDYLIEHPEVMLEVQQALQKKQEEARLAQSKAAVEENQDAIFNASGDFVLGNPKGKITVVEFYDYNCGYCKRAIGDMDAVIKSNPEVRFVLKDFPILGPDSLAAHKVADAFRRIAPNKYGKFHRELLGGQAHANEARALEVAESLGVKESAIRKKIAENAEDSGVQQTYKLASQLGISGTPSYVLADEAIFGAVGADTLNEKVANVAQCGKTAC